MQDSNLEVSRHLFASRLNDLSRTDWAIEDQAKKTWTQQPVPMMSEHSAQLTLLPFGFCTWLWRYTCLLLLISMLWHRQAMFESKGDKLSNRKYQPYPLLSYFSMVVCLSCLLINILSLNCIYSPGNWEFASIIIVHFTISTNRWIPFG